ncbi:hypothetical protein D3C72_2293410 [compost metagenome]
MHVGIATEAFQITDEGGGEARRVSVKRLGTDAVSVYEAGPGSAWVEEFESDLECGLFGRVAA